MERKELYIQALAAERAGDWNKAHRIVQEIGTTEAAWIHAYLHRAEGDLSNAAYWYRRARKPECHAPLDEEWQEIYRTIESMPSP